MQPPRLSVIVITRNEAHRIERCLRSVAFADEVVVLDSGSVDATVERARKAGARVVESPDWPGFGPQKNRALALAHGEWVFSIDADEEVTPALQRSILLVVSGRGAVGCAGYWVTRSSSFCGRVVRHGDWRNDRVLRLFRRDVARFSDEVVHERVECPEPHGRLDGLLLHDSVDTLDDAREKTERYARLGAQKLSAKGRGGLARALLHGGWAFLRGYLLRLGFLDGGAGLQIAALSARGTYLRYRLAASRGEGTRSTDTHGDSSR